MDILISDIYYQWARRLHHTCPVVDAHLDLAGEILLRYQAGEREVIKNHYLEHFQEAGVNLIVSSVYVDNTMLPEAGLRNALDQIVAFAQDVQSASEYVLWVKDRQELEYAIGYNKIGIMLYMEGLDCIGKDLGLLRIFYELGIRGASLTWSRRNELATGCCAAREYIQIKGGLSLTGENAVRELERLSCFVDISHLNDDGFEDIIHIAEKPLAATHSNARSVYDNYRNLTDEQIKLLTERGGIIGINGCALIAGSEEEGNHIEMLCKHIEHIVNLSGSNCVGYGFDLCDSYCLAEPRVNFITERNDCLKNHGEMMLVTAGLLQRGMSEENVKRIIGGNFLQFFRQILVNL